ncbi:terminase small subunit [Chryseobacterium sp. JV274]|uniref:terminase small subunit n=1 Tax=Chryseobacterium sp. JV274 TaxID=1932669 RepID=UPI0015C1DC6B|nr:terminase small subunit [Chryseobacterium sp. JV274]CAD0220346.1 DNA-packaging protein gp3 [Chryseobacterium sp. JV274]
MAKKKSEENEGRKPDGKFAEGNKFSPGRTPVYSNGEELAEKLLEYFEWIKGEFIIERKITSKTTGKGKDAVTTTEDEPVKIWTRYPEEPTMTGLAMYLGFESRQSLYDYGKKDGFSYPIKRALLEVENNYEKGLFGDKVVGVIWGLKNMGWTDKTETKLTGDPDNPVEIKEQTKIIFTRGFGDSK